MADVKRTVEILFLGNDKVSKTIREISGAVGQFDTVIQSVAKPMATLADGVIKVDAALAALAVGGMALAINKASQFETSFREISTLLDISAENIGGFRNDLIEYASSSTKSLEDINGAVYSAISAGISYKTALSTLSQAEKLSVAGKADLKDTILLVASTLNAYGASTEEAGRYTNAFFNTVKLGQTTLPELSTALSKVTGIAAAAGIPIEDLTAAVAALTVAGMPTTEAITGLKQVIASILAPGSEAEKLFKQLGIEYGKNALQAKGLDGVLAEMSRKTKGNADSMKTLLGGVEALNAGLILATDRSGKYAEALETMRAGQDVVSAAFEKMAGSVHAANQTLANNVDILLIQVGERMVAGYKDVAGGLTEIFRAMQDSVAAGAFDDMFALITEFGADLKKFLEEVAKAIPEAFDEVDFAELLDALKDLGREFGMIFDDIDLTTPEGLAEAIQGAVDTMESLVRVTQGMVQYFEPLWDSLAEGVERFNGLSDAEKLASGELLGAAELVAKAGTQIGLALVAIQKSGADIKDVFDLVIGGIKAGWNVLQVAFDQIMIMSSEVVSKLLWLADKGTLVTIPFSDLNERVKEAKASVEDFLGGAKLNQFENMKDLIEGSNQALDGFQGKAKEAAEAAEEMGRSVREVSEAVDTNVPAVKNVEVVIDEAGNIDEAGKKLTKAIPEEMTTYLKITTKDGSPLITNKDVKEAIPEKADLLVYTKPDMESIENTKNEITDEFKAKADLLKTAIEVKGKVDITEIESATKQFETSIGSVNTGLQETTKLMTQAFTSLTSKSSTERFEARRTIEQEREIRERQALLQEQLLSQQIELMEAKKRALDNGEALIKISAEGLEPALETVLYEIIKKVQIRAQEEASEFLLGLAAGGA